MKKRITIALLIFVFLASACGQKNTNLPFLNGDIPTQAPTPTITPTPMPQERLSLGEKYIISGDYDAAYEEFQITLAQTTDPEITTAAMLGLGRVLIFKEQYRAAIDQFSQLLTNYPTGLKSRDTAYFFIAKAYEAADQPRLAADAYASYLTILPGLLDSEIQVMRGDALMDANDPSSALTAYEQALSTSTSETYDEIQIKRSYAAVGMGDDAKAISILIDLYNSSSSGYYKAQANLLMGQIYLRLGQPEQAYTRFQDSITYYPEYYDSYSGLVALVEAGEIVDNRQRGITDYFAGQYAVAVQALDQYLLETSSHDGSAHYYKALSLYEIGDYQGEIDAWDQLIRDHDTDETYYPKALVEKSQTQWSKLKQFQEAAETCLIYVQRFPEAPKASFFLNRAANIFEIGGYLSVAAETYERVFDEYPGSEEAYQALFKAGILYYRLTDYLKAQVTFQRLLILAITPEEQAAANLWVSKSLEKQGKNAEAATYIQSAVNADPTGYYSIRASQILNNQPLFPSVSNVDLAVDFEMEKSKADSWMREKFQLDNNIDLNTPADLYLNNLFLRAEEHARLGMRENARGEYEILRDQLLNDPVNTYRLMNRLLDLGFYRSAALASRQILNLAGLTELSTLTSAPDYFNHIRFGSFYRETVAPVAVEHNLDSLLLFSIIRQESMFDSSIVSSAGAQGLMQIMPATGEEIVSDYGWPENYTVSDLNRPVINIRLGTHYLRKWLDYFDDQYYKALAAYNAGPGYAIAWQDLAGDDPDLYLEIMRSDETKQYIMSITEYHEIYKKLYTH